ncbi:glycosyltransferase family 2 protein [Hymenobacter busanensis]|uniref:Glycosyltransferase family 2 protein n=1 Tax=Hymenobacter busanensis TaxID=2607656 RepID=A0A7L4ZWL6_9BACT|nr:glycosyltransferase [Hymenobacter busanensis]KAA9332270.1 glycosyltransferase family 2 protein [Hymenobacter busanensis]QHJ07393.1 glycosyltransferase [Hymenobacter busanensis]
MTASSQPAGVSVIICTHNGADRLPATLKHLANQRVDVMLNWEVIVVDNNSTDGTQATAQTLWKEFGAPTELLALFQPIPGKNRALELAYETARFSYVCIVDDDNWLNSDYIQRGYDLLESDERIGVLGGGNEGVFEIEKPEWFDAFRISYAVGTPMSQAYTPLETGEVVDGVLWGAGMFFRHELWQKLRQLQFESLFTGRIGTKNMVAGEDDELCLAVRMLGYKIWFDADLHLKHFMTANRLNWAYMQRILYSSVWSVVRLSVYSFAQRSDAEKYLGIWPWLVDLLYVTWSICKEVLSGPFWRATFHQDKYYFANFKWRLLRLYAMVKDYKLSRRNFCKVYGFKQRINAKFSVCQPVNFM